MDDFFRITATCLCGAMLSLMLKKEHPVWCICIAAGTSVAVLVQCVPYIKAVLELTDTLKSKLPNAEWIVLLIKLSGLTLLGEWSLQLLKDAGENTVALKLEVALKLLILGLCIPVLTQLFSLITGVLEHIGSG